MNKDEKIAKLKQIINRLIYSNWRTNIEDGYIYLLYAPKKFTFPYKCSDKLRCLEKEFKKKICETEGIEEI
jgi:hypothetical protein